MGDIYDTMWEAANGQKIIDDVLQAYKNAGVMEGITVAEEEYMRKRMNESLLDIIRETLSVQAAEDTITYYLSPGGAEYLEKMPAIMEKAANLGLQVVQEMVEEA